MLGVTSLQALTRSHNHCQIGAARAAIVVATSYGLCAASYGTPQQNGRGFTVHCYFCIWSNWGCQSGEAFPTSLWPFGCKVASRDDDFFTSRRRLLEIIIVRREQCFVIFTLVLFVLLLCLSRSPPPPPPPAFTVHVSGPRAL